ncbi:hypothetical protein B8V81_1863 [Paenibacillus pasadenensis]|uniref:Uncharacterized protein n=1 Tax=Paenibacillus pasadenensis TaxID=217090 RepID=A0A2N5NBB4_9BACL|nr:hypothetical protein B8V81_1863 [Paenibacillus pasadenensis]
MTRNVTFIGGLITPLQTYASGRELLSFQRRREPNAVYHHFRITFI